MLHRLPELSYDFHELAAFIAPKEFQLNYFEIHKGYVENLNKALSKDISYQQYSVADLMMKLKYLPEDLRYDVKKYGGMHFNYSLFWKILTPSSRGPMGTLKNAIRDTYHDFGVFKKEFTNIALDLNASDAWCWLLVQKGKVKIMKTYGHDCPISKDTYPVLCLKLWRVSSLFVKQKQNLEYINDFWNFINWEEAESRYLEGKRQIFI
ncbi:superoxide dismutase [Bacillus pseudomycoides]|uniref:superoxide dismutase n=1 Tax=Bacillus pseudomycoides TaxID=64104 RepID=UPI000BF0B4C0|nr:superoxide dismutase [Bacillus pseudomycoides]PEM68547.1 hypothetical protein CN619_23340 [Bacillus pseudomycoides]